MKARNVALAAALGLAGWLVSLASGTHSRVVRWPSDDGRSPDSIGREMAISIGARPEVIARCGPHHVGIGYVNAPIDLRQEFTRAPSGQRVFYDSRAQQTRFAVAATIAEIFLTIAGNPELDTVTVRLTRTARTGGWFSNGMSETVTYTLAPPSLMRDSMFPRLIDSREPSCALAL